MNDVGVLFVNYRTACVFDDVLRGTIQLFASHAAMAIRNTRLTESAQRKNAEFEVLTKIGQTVSAHGLERILEVVYEQASLLMDTTNFFICLLDPEQNELRFEMWMHEGERLERFSEKVSGLAGWVIREKKSLLIRDLDKEEGRLPAKAEIVTERQRSWLGVPLLLSDRVLGAISVQSPRPQEFDSETQRVLEIIAAQAAVAIENAQLLQNERRRADTLDLLREISGNISSARGIGRTLASIVEGAMRLTETTSGVIHLVDETGRFIIRSFEYPKDFKHPIPRLSEEESMTRTIIDTGLPKAVPDIAKERRVNKVMLDKGVKSLIGLPIKLERKVIGVLYLNAEKPRQFTQEQQTLLLTLAEQAAIAIQNSDDATSLQRQVEQHHILNHYAASLVNAMNEQAVLDKAAFAASEILKCTHSTVFRVDGPTLSVAATIGDRESYFHRGRIFELRDRSAEHATQQEWATLVSDAVNASETGQKRPSADVPKSRIAAPVSRDGRVGYVIWSEQERAQAFNRYDQQLLDALALQVRQVLINVRLHEAELRKAEQLKRLSEVALAITEMTGEKASLKRTLEEVLEGIDTILGLETSGCINLYDASTRRFGESFVYGPCMSTYELTDPVQMELAPMWFEIRLHFM